MNAIILFCVILFAYLLLWVGINYIRLIVIFNNTQKCFFALDEFVKQTVFPVANSDIAKTHIHWYLATDDINRKLALTKSIISTIKEFEEYSTINCRIIPYIEKYNKNAAELRRLTEIFPTSFIARLKEIKGVHIYNL